MRGRACDGGDGQVIRRIELLPASYRERQRQRRTLTGIVGAGVVGLVLLGLYWFMLGGQINTAEEELAGVQAQNAQLQSQIAELQEFADLAAEVQTKRQALATVMTDDIDWPSILTELAMVVPGEVWLTNMTASFGAGEGASQVGTETAEVRINPELAIGRITFSGSSLSMPGVAKWLIRLATVREFEAIWLGDASGGNLVGGRPVFTFNSTIELNNKAKSDRFQEGVEP